MGKNKSLIVLWVFLILLSSFKAFGFSNCSPNYDFYIQDFSNVTNVSYLLKVNDTSSSCQDEWNCWAGYSSLIFSYPEQFENGFERDKALQIDTFYYSFFVKSNFSGDFLVNLTFSEPSLPDCVIDLPLVFSYSTDYPNISVVFPQIPVLISDTTYSFNISINNSGNATAYDFTGNILFNQNFINLSNGSFSLNIPSNSIHNHTFYLNANESGNYSINFSSDNLIYYNLYGTLMPSIQASPIHFYVNFPPLFYDHLTYGHGFTSNYSITNQSVLSFNLSNNLYGHYFDNDSYDTVLNWSEPVKTIVQSISNSIEFNITITFDNSTQNLTINSLGGWTGEANITLRIYDTINETANVSFILFVNNGSEEICDNIDNNLDGRNNEGLIGNSIGSAGEIGMYNEGCGYYQNRCGINGEYPDFISTPDQCSSSGTSHGGGGSLNIPALTPTLSISSPTDSSLHIVNTSIPFHSSIQSVSSLEWSFGDGETSTSLNPSHTYTQTGYYEVTLEAANQDLSDSITLHIVDCLVQSDCTSGICCNNFCVQPICSVDSDCARPDPIINEFCFSPNSCTSNCQFSTCPVECTSNSMCDDLDDSTTDTCQNSGLCSSSCLYTPSDLEISIYQPNSGTYPDVNVPVDWETNYDVDCFYQLNSGNRERLYQNQFDLTAREGQNTFTIFCGVKEKRVSFNVVIPPEGERDLNYSNKAGQSVFDNLLQNQAQVLTDEQVLVTLNTILNSSGFDIKRTAKIVNMTTNISLKVTNKNIVGYVTVSEHEFIPKEVFDSTDYILPGDYFIISKDPEIGFNIGDVPAGGYKEISYIINNSINRSLLEFIVSSISGGVPNQSELDELIKKQQATANETIITKKITNVDGKTIVDQQFKPKKGMKNVDVYLSIPKCMAEKLNELYFKNKNYKIISDDPMVVWHFDEITDDIDLSYEVLKDITDKDCQDQAIIMAIANEIDSKLLNKKSGMDLKSLLPLLIIPLIAFIVLYGHKFVKPEEVPIDTIKREQLANRYVGQISGYVEKSFSQGLSLGNIVQNLRGVGWSEDFIKESLHHLRHKHMRRALRRYYEMR